MFLVFDLCLADGEGKMFLPLFLLSSLKPGEHHPDCPNYRPPEGKKSKGGSTKVGFAAEGENFADGYELIFGKKSSLPN
ncbi:hypothetical protein KW786_02160 [Candidatus Parcubacteria bacterium]|nr:hypothetical protein [Candidatus Parcubacteria bacterium]